VLITHCAPRALCESESGLREAAFVDERCQPAYHFYSHHRGPIPPAESADTGATGSTTSTSAGHERHASYEHLNEDAWASEWDSQNDHRFEIVREPCRGRSLGHLAPHIDRQDLREMSVSAPVPGWNIACGPDDGLAMRTFGF